MGILDGHERAFKYMCASCRIELLELGGIHADHNIFEWVEGRWMLMAEPIREGELPPDEERYQDEHDYAAKYIK